MALTLVTTPGAASANAYCDLTDVNAVADELFPTPDAWLTAGTEDQARAIVAATRRIDQERFRGQRVDSTQALEFPRSGVPDAAELSCESLTAIPERVKRATALLAIELYRLWTVSGGQVTGPSESAGMQSFSLGSEFSATLEAGAGQVTPAERFFAQTIRPVLGNLVIGPQARVMRG